MLSSDFSEAQSQIFIMWVGTAAKVFKVGG